MIRGGGIGVSEANFVIQVRVNQKWSTAHGLSSEQSLQKFLPRLMAEHGDIIRALRASRDISTGKTKWSVYKYSEARQPPNLSRGATPRPYAVDDSVADNVFDAYGVPRTEFPDMETDQAPPTLSDDASQAPGIEVKASGKKPRWSLVRKIDVRKWVLAPLIRSLKVSAAVFGNYVLAPLVNGVRMLVELLRKLATIENKADRISSFATDSLARLDNRLRRPESQWTMCALGAVTGLSIAFMASVPGGLTMAVLATCFVPPLRRYLLSKPDRHLSSRATTVLVLLLLVSSASLDLGNPGRRVTNANVNYFQAHREEVIAGARASADQGQYLAVIAQLDRFLAAGDEDVSALYLAARPHAEAELARQEKIASQFLFNGSNKHLTDYIVATMDDPGSFRHIRTSHQVEGDHIEVETTYSGSNETGVLFTRAVTAVLDLDGRVIHER